MRAPVDFEECAADAERNATSSEDKGSQLAACEARFAGRRKPGGGYTYYDFMQNRHFDIAGPNPTTQEQRHIDEQYAAFLKDQRRSIIAAAFFRKRQQVEQAPATLEAIAFSSEADIASREENASNQQAGVFRRFRETVKDSSGKAEPGNIRLTPADRKTLKERVAVLPRPRPKTAPHCGDDILSTCNWSRISTGVHDLKEAFFGSLVEMSATDAHSVRAHLPAAGATRAAK